MITKLMNRVKRGFKNEEGAVAMEYMLLLGVVSVAIIGAMVAVPGIMTTIIGLTTAAVSKRN